MSWNATWRERWHYAVLTAIGPVLWVATDFVVTGNPLFSLTSTQDLAAELERQKSGSDVITTLPGYLRGTVKTPVFFAGPDRPRDRASGDFRCGRDTAVLFCAGVFTFVATGLAGLSVIVRYLLVPVGDAEPVRGRCVRRIHDAAAGLAEAAGLGGRRGDRQSRSDRLDGASTPPSFARFNNELVYPRRLRPRASTRCSGKPAVKRGCAAGRSRCRHTS